jgi:hypothetical protein
MSTPLDLATASRDELLSVIAGLEQTVTTLQQQVEALQRRLGSGGKGMPGTKPSASTRSTASGQPRKRRPHGFARRRSATPSSQVVHAADTCPYCATPLQGNAAYRQYPVFHAAGVSPESGAVESRARHLIQQRFKRAGKLCPRLQQNCLTT